MRAIDARQRMEKGVIDRRESKYKKIIEQIGNSSYQFAASEIYVLKTEIDDQIIKQLEQDGYRVEKCPNPPSGYYIRWKIL